MESIEEEDENQVHLDKPLQQQYGAVKPPNDIANSSQININDTQSSQISIAPTPIKNEVRNLGP